MTENLIPNFKLWWALCLIATFAMICLFLCLLLLPTLCCGYSPFSWPMLIAALIAIISGHIGFHQAPEDSRQYSDCLVCLILNYAGAIFALGVIITTPDGREKANVTKCKNNLKQIGLSLHSYFEDHDDWRFPQTQASGKVDQRAVLYFGLDANMLTCPAATKNTHPTEYLWNPAVAGGRWSDWNHAGSPLIWDATPHKVSGKINVLFGDGHVEEVAREKLYP